MQMPRHQTREIAALKALQKYHQHPNIVRLDNLVLDEDSRQGHLVLELCTKALGDLIETAYEECQQGTAGEGLGIGRRQTLAFTRDIAAGLVHCHALGLMHRDLKPQNVLLCADGHAKLCDFGMTCGVAFERPLTPQMITLWYRAPEVLLGSQHYGTAVDIWALGCIVYEMCWLRPPFIGQTEMKMLQVVFDAFGVPGAVHDSVVQFEYTRRASIVPRSIAKCGELAALLGRMLRLEPLARPTAQAALATATDLLAGTLATADNKKHAGADTGIPRGIEAAAAACSEQLAGADTGIPRGIEAAAAACSEQLAGADTGIPRGIEAAAAASSEQRAGADTGIPRGSAFHEQRAGADTGIPRGSAASSEKRAARSEQRASNSQGRTTAGDSVLAEDFGDANASPAKRKRRCLSAD